MSEEDRVSRGKELGQMDYTDIENPYVSFSRSLSCPFNLIIDVDSCIKCIEYFLQLVFDMLTKRYSSDMLCNTTSYYSMRNAAQHRI